MLSMEDEASIIEGSLHPSTTNDPALQRVNIPSAPISPKVFIENKSLSSLVNLCVQVLARSFGPQPHAIVASNPLWLQVYYDALDVDLPLAKCYNITEERFWKRLVLTKHRDKTLALKANVNWKNLGVSIKYVELVEKCPAEYWPEDEMKELALKVKEYVTEMHIKRLQSLKQRAFEKYFHSETESTTEESEQSASEEVASEISQVTTSTEKDLKEATMNASQLQLRNHTAELKKERLELRQAKLKAREAKQKQNEKFTREKPKKKPPRKIIYSVFDIEVSDSEGSEEQHIIDKRNKALLLKRIKKYNYPAKDCHHIDLKFVQYFTNLITFTLEFLGPIQTRHYQERHLNFSYDDMKHLAKGLSCLSNLKIFRLRNSRMDALKLQTLCCALGLLPNLETLDFGCDQLKDDCGFVFEDFFQMTKSLKNLELETNCLGVEVLTAIGKALSNYKANELLYLGLAHNPITDKALHSLVSAIIGTKHIQELNIRGALFVTDVGLCCCFANELLKQHLNLIKLDVCAIQMSPLAANEIIKALDKNQKILEFYCSCCGLDEETEIDVHVIMKRNKFILEHYYIGDPTVTVEEITKWLNSIRDPILLKVLAEREQQKQCLENLSEDIKPESRQQDSLLKKSQMFAGQLSEMQVSAKPSAHAAELSAQERYSYYFKILKRRLLLLDSIKNKSTF